MLKLRIKLNTLPYISFKRWANTSIKKSLFPTQTAGFRHSRNSQDVQCWNYENKGLSYKAFMSTVHVNITELFFLTKTAVWEYINENKALSHTAFKNSVNINITRSIFLYSNCWSYTFMKFILCPMLSKTIGITITKQFLT